MKVDKNLCVGCSACCGVCPAGAISLVGGKSEIDQTKCVNCGTCISMCPMSAIAQ